jgi:hypothetical protein
MVEHLRRSNVRGDLARLVTPRHPFHSRHTRANDIRLLAACLSNIEDLAAPLAELDEGATVPVLLRQYMRLGGRVAAFNVDREFSNVLDALLIVDLRETASRLLVKYMGRECATVFLQEVHRSGSEPRSNIVSARRARASPLNQPAAKSRVADLL